MKPSAFDQLALAVLTAAFLLPSSPARAGQLEAGPNGGRIVGAPPDQAELLISPDGIVTVTFLDAERKPAPPGTRSAAVFAQLDSGKKEIALRPEGDTFVSTEPLPEPEGYTLVVQTRATPEGKPVNTRVTYNVQVCGGCHLAEYACTCEGH